MSGISIPVLPLAVTWNVSRTNDQNVRSGAIRDVYMLRKLMNVKGHISPRKSTLDVPVHLMMIVRHRSKRCCFFLPLASWAWAGRVCWRRRPGASWAGHRANSATPLERAKMTTRTTSLWFLSTYSAFRMLILCGFSRTYLKSTWNWNCPYLPF